MGDTKIEPTGRVTHPELSFCIVSMNKRALLLDCLESIFNAPPSCEFEVLVLDNASEDDSVDAVKARYGDRVQLVALERRLGKAENDTKLLESSRGRYALLLNDDSELKPGAVEALYRALEKWPNAAAAGACLLQPDGRAQPSAWRFPGLKTALLNAVFFGRVGVVQSTGNRVREVDWAQSAALMVRREAFEDVGGLDPQFFVYSDEVDWCKRASDAGWIILYVPTAEVTHHEQLAGFHISERRIVEFSRNRERYVRKHHGAFTAWTVRLLTAWTYSVRAAVALLLPGHDPKRYWLHVRQTLIPGHREGLLEAAEDFNRRLCAARQQSRQ